MNGRDAPPPGRERSVPLPPIVRTPEEKAAALEPGRVVVIEEDRFAAAALDDFFRAMVVEALQLRMTNDVVDRSVRFHPDAVLVNVDPPDAAVVTVAGMIAARLPAVLIVCPSRSAARRLRRTVPLPRLVAVEKPYSVERLLEMLEIILNKRPLSKQ
jgi:DNA-binding NtrC family response regulator